MEQTITRIMHVPIDALRWRVLVPPDIRYKPGTYLYYESEIDDIELLRFQGEKYYYGYGLKSKTLVIADVPTGMLE
jgi:hypothetical protein